MTYFADLSESTMVTAGTYVRAIGWLSREHAFCNGETSPEFAQRLSEICENWMSCVEAIGFGLFMGIHTCELCGAFRAAGNIAVPSDHLLYVAPEMVHHYVTNHQYQPPAEFINAVMACPIPGTTEYQELVRPFRALQAAYFAERWKRMVGHAASWAREHGGESAIQEAGLRFLGNRCDEYLEQVRRALSDLSRQDV